jgi:hypothetical protein
MLLLLVVALLAVSTMAGAWYGRLQERAAWTRRLIERGINPGTLIPRGGGMPQPSVDAFDDFEPLQPLEPDADAMRDAMEAMSREVERLSEGQRFLTQVLTEKRALVQALEQPRGDGAEPSPSTPPSPATDHGSDAALEPRPDRPSGS